MTVATLPGRLLRRRWSSTSTAGATSKQSYLLDALHAQAAHLRRQAALSRVSERLHGRPAVDEADRHAVLDAVHGTHAERADQLTDHTQ